MFGLEFFWGDGCSESPSHSYKLEQCDRNKGLGFRVRTGQPIKKATGLDSWADLNIFWLVTWSLNKVPYLLERVLKYGPLGFYGSGVHKACIRGPQLGAIIAGLCLP